MDTKETFSRIREVLLRDWDPIGVSAVPQAQDEYDSYVPAIYGLVMRAASTDEIAQHLASIERDRMGLSPTADRLEPVAQKLKAINLGTGGRSA